MRGRAEKLSSGYWKRFNETPQFENQGSGETWLRRASRENLGCNVAHKCTTSADRFCKGSVKSSQRKCKTGPGVVKTNESVRMMPTCLSAFIRAHVCVTVQMN